MNDMIIHAEKGYPEEVCGAMMSYKEDPDRVVFSQRLNNSFDGPKHDRFLIDPIELYRTEKESIKRGLMVIGIYHSHPDSTAHPSKFDLDHSFPLYKYLIVSVVKGRFSHAKCWFTDINRTAFREEPVVV